MWLLRLRGLDLFVYPPKNDVLLDNSDPDRRGGGGRGRVANLPAEHTQLSTEHNSMNKHEVQHH